MEFGVDTVLNIGSDEFYRAARYQTALVVILINSKDKDLFNIIEKNLRPTDIIQQLNSELIVLFLSHTGYDDATLFINKIKESKDFSYTVSEYKGFRVEFVEKLFSENEKKFI